MRSVLMVIFLAVLIQVSIFKSAYGEDPWLADTFAALYDLGNVAQLKSRICRNEVERLDCYKQKLTEYLPKFEKFLTNSQLSEEVREIKLFPLRTAFESFTDDAQDDYIDVIERDFLTSSSLKEKYNSDFKPLMEALRDDVEETASRDPLAQSGYSLPLETECADLPARNVPTLSVKDVCPTFSQCASSFHLSTADACGENKRCDVTRAIPLMIGLFYYKVSFAFVDRFCPERCSADNGCNMEDTFASIAKQVELLKAFLIPENPFEQFFRDAVTRRAYSQIGPAMELISENEPIFVLYSLNFLRLACEEIESEPGCLLEISYTRFYPNYLLLKKMNEERQQRGGTRDLTLYENVDHAKVIQLKQEAIKHTELLSSIQQLNSNLEVQVKGIASYFEGIATFDQGIANADVVFIRDKLNTFDSDYATLQAKLKNDFRAGMIATTTLLSIQLAEETIALVAKIAEESNPIAALFTGVDTKGVRDQAKEVADAAADLAHQIALFAKLGELAEETIKIGACLQDNQNQITTMEALVNKIKNNQADQIGDDAEKFIEEYSGYTPKVDRSRMAKNIAMWGAFKDSTCDLLNDVEGIFASAGKAVANGFLLCENLEGTIAEFDALRENIFDFQFELVDSLARVVRGNVAKKLAASIQGQANDLFKADQLLGGFLMTQIFIQSHAWLYCDKLEYRNEGTSVQPCSPETGLFTNSDLDNLVAFTDHQNYISIERTVYIPSKPQHNGDLGFINIQTFAREKTASFRLPQSINWLYKFDWSLIGESHAPYVENFQLFLPNKEYKTGAEKEKTTTRIVITADTETGSYISANQENSVLYKLPEFQTSYVTVYQEGYRSSTCPNEIPNPYSLCDNLPKICHTSTNVAGDSLLPTTLSRWRVTYTVQSGEQEVQWSAPNSVTDLYFIAKLTLRMLPRKSAEKRSDIPPPAPVDVCCEDGKYRSSLITNECDDCPSGSTSKLGGYYCEKDDEPNPSPGKKKQHVFQREASHKHRHFIASSASSGASKIRRMKGYHSKK